jgi:hypothetical protein
VCIPLLLVRVHIFCLLFLLLLALLHQLQLQQLSYQVRCVARGQLCMDQDVPQLRPATLILLNQLPVRVGQGDVVTSTAGMQSNWGGSRRRSHFFVSFGFLACSQGWWLVHTQQDVELQQQLLRVWQVRVQHSCTRCHLHAAH